MQNKAFPDVAWKAASIHLIRAAVVKIPTASIPVECKDHRSKYSISKADIKI